MKGLDGVGKRTNLRVNKKTKHVKLFQKGIFLTPWYANVYIFISGKFGVFCLLVMSVLRSVILPYYRRYVDGNWRLTFCFKGATELHRGYEYECKVKDCLKEVSHIVLLIHGMGQLYHTDGGIVNSRKK